MKQQPATYGSFTIERNYGASPEEVFAAWSSADAKAQWFIGPEGWIEIQRELDFRVGGHELLHGRHANGQDTLYTARFHEIVPNRRIVFVYDMHYEVPHIDGQNPAKEHLSVSLATVEFEPAKDGTRLRFTEQIVFLNGTSGVEGTSMREHGTGVLLDQLGARFPVQPRV